MFINFQAPIQALIFGKVTQKSGRWHDGRTLACHLLVYCCEGDFSMTVDGVTHEAKVGDTILIPANSFYVPHTKHGVTYRFFHFNAFLGTQEKSELHVSHHDLPANNYALVYPTLENECAEVCILTPCTGNKRVEDLFLQAEETTFQPSITKKILLDSLLRELLVLLSKEFSQEQIRPRRLGEILQFVQDNYEKPLSLSTVAKHFYISESYLARLFRVELHTSLSHYLNRLRVNVAQNLLLHTNLHVTEIAEQVGFASTHYFSRTFKELTGESPLLFRQNRI